MFKTVHHKIFMFLDKRFFGFSHSILFVISPGQINVFAAVLLIVDHGVDTVFAHAQFVFGILRVLVGQVDRVELSGEAE